MNLAPILLVATLAFPAGEIVLALTRRARPGQARAADAGSERILWLVISASVGAAMAGSWVPGARLPVSPGFLGLLALALLCSGLALRWTAILQLGRLFTVNVAIQPGHELVERGLYRFLRHPSYSGLLLAFCGLGVYFGTWISVFFLTVPVTMAVLHRIRLEEKALRESLGPQYERYCARTRRLVPGIY